MTEKLYPTSEVVAEAQDFRDKLIEFRAEVFDFFSVIAERYSPNGIAEFSKAADEFDARLFYMATGIKMDLPSDLYSHLVNEVGVRKDVILEHFDNKDVIKDAYSFEKMMPRATNFIRASMVGNNALTDEAKEELKKLDDLHKGE